MVTGVIAGGSASGKAIGVAPGAQWIAAKIFDDAGVAVNSQIIAAFQWVLDPDGNPATDDAPGVVNGSWGLEGEENVCDGIFRTAIQNLRGGRHCRGVRGRQLCFPPTPANTSISPANYPESFAVGAIDQSSSLAGFSDRGPSACDDSTYPRIVAPGVHVRTSTDPASNPDGDLYASVSGTSFSAPHVAGVMALLLSADPELPASRLESILQLSATPLGTSTPNDDYGYGMVNAAAAYDLVSAARKNAANTPPPAATLVAPAGGATGLALPVVLQWTQDPDADGDAIINSVLVSQSPDFTGAVPFPAVAAASGGFPCRRAPADFSSSAWPPVGPAAPEIGDNAPAGLSARPAGRLQRRLF